MNAFPGLLPVPGLDLLPPGLFCLHPATLSWGTFGSDTSIASLGIWVRSVFLGKILDGALRVPDILEKKYLVKEKCRRHLGCKEKTC